MEEETLPLQLHKLWPLKSEEALQNLLQTLWKTRKSGLSSLQKSYLHSLLGLPSIQEFDPVLACLRSLIRKCVHNSISGDDIQKLFPLDLPVELHSILLLLFQKYQNQWKEEALRDQVKISKPPAPTPTATSELLSSTWPRQDEPTRCFTPSNTGTPPTMDNSNLPRMAPVSLHQEDITLDKFASLPRLKSMTWTLENRSSPAGTRVAIITLKLQDYTNTPSGETEVKFQLSKDTLEAMLRSMTYISEQLSNVVEPPSPPLMKKQRQ